MPKSPSAFKLKLNRAILKLVSTSNKNDPEYGSRSKKRTALISRQNFLQR